MLIENLPTGGLAVLNYDDDRTRTLATRTQAKSLTVGLEGFGADLTAYNVVLGATGTGFDVRFGATVTSDAGRRCWASTSCTRRWRRWRSAWSSTSPRPTRSRR